MNCSCFALLQSGLDGIQCPTADKSDVGPRLKYSSSNCIHVELLNDAQRPQKSAKNTFVQYFGTVSTSPTGVLAPVLALLCCQRFLLQMLVTKKKKKKENRVMFCSGLSEFLTPNLTFHFREQLWVDMLQHWVIPFLNLIATLESLSYGFG